MSLRRSVIKRDVRSNIQNVRAVPIKRDNRASLQNSHPARLLVADESAVRRLITDGSVRLLAESAAGIRRLVQMPTPLDLVPVDSGDDDYAAWVASF